jgi:hypothetical protein
MMAIWQTQKPVRRQCGKTAQKSPNPMMDNLGKSMMRIWCATD